MKTRILAAVLGTVMLGGVVLPLSANAKPLYHRVDRTHSGTIYYCEGEPSMPEEGIWHCYGYYKSNGSWYGPADLRFAY